MVNLSCPKCSSNFLWKYGCDHKGRQKYFCKQCRTQFVPEANQRKQLNIKCPWCGCAMEVYKCRKLYTRYRCCSIHYKNRKACRCKEYTPGVFDLDKVELTNGITKWVEILRFGDPEEVTGRRPLLTAMQAVFDVYYSFPEGTILDIAVSREDEYEYKKRVVESTLRDTDYRLHITSADKLPQDGKWIGLEGTTTEWMTTLEKAARGFFKVKSERSLGHQFKQLLGEEPRFIGNNKEGEPVDNWGYRFVKLNNAGPYQSQRGWRIMVKVDE